MDAFEYKAFISYSHRDAAWAQWLLGALETYRLPDGKVRGVGRIFRDRDEAGAASDLKDEIERALLASEHLIVIASPNSARSKYVSAEIEAFAAANARREVPGRILTLIVDGEPNVSSGDTTDPRECFPPELRGKLTKTDGTPLEPLAADARPVGDGKTRSLAKLVSGLMSIRYDTLVRRDLIRRRRAQGLAIAAAVVAIVIAGAVTAVVVSGNLEQERLRIASESAARDARTVTAVNTAERAHRLLDAGDPSGAMALAKQSLPLDGSVPFIPQAYDVMYRSIYDRTQEVEVDLAGYHNSAPVVLAAGDAHYLVYNDTGTAAMWTPSHGVVYRRADLAWSSHPSVAADGSAIFLAGVQSLLRLSLPDRVWSDIDLSVVFGDITPPAFIAGIDATSLYACRESELMRISIDSELVGAADWKLALPAPCSALTLAPDGSAIVGVQSFAVKVDSKGDVQRTYGPAGELIVQRVYATGDAVILSHVGGTFVYRNDDTAPLVIEGRGMDYFALSPDGRWFVYSDVDNGRLVVTDLKSGETHEVACTCVFVGYYRDNQFMAAGDRAIESYDLTTGAATGVVHVFSAPAETYVYEDEDNLLIALRRSGPESVAFLDAAKSPTLLVDGAMDPRTGLLSANFSGAHHIAMREVGPEGLSLNLLDRSAAASPPQPTRAARGTYSSMVPLTEGKIGLLEGLDDEIGWRVSVRDGDSGEELWGAKTFSDPRLKRGDRFIGTDGDNGLAVHDVTGGADLTFADHTLSWSIAGDVILRAVAGTDALELRAQRLGNDSPASLWSRAIDSAAYVLCITPDGGLAYQVRNANGALQLEQFSMTDGSVTAQIEARDTTLLDDGDIRAVFDISCDAASLRMSGSPSQQWRWDVARATLLAEPLAPTPPRGSETAGFDSLAELADGVVGWDDEGAWLYDPSRNVTAVALASGGGRLSSTLYLAGDGYAVLGYESGRVQVWDVQHASAAMIDMTPHTAPVVSLDYDPDSRLLLSADQEGTIHLWPLPAPADLLAQTAR